jgi:hypothetical protein
MMMQMPKLPKSVQAFSAMALMTVANTLPVSAKALESTTSKIAKTTTEEVAYKAGCYAQGKGGDLFVKVEEYTIKPNIPNVSTKGNTYNEAKALCSDQLESLGNTGGLTPITTNKLPKKAKKELLESSGNLIVLPAGTVATSVVAEVATQQKPTTVMQTNTLETGIPVVNPSIKPEIFKNSNQTSKYKKTVGSGENQSQKVPRKQFTTQSKDRRYELLTPSLEEGSHDIRRGMVGDKRVVASSTPEQAMAICYGENPDNKGTLKIQRLGTIPARLRNASVKQLLQKVKDFDSFVADCKKNGVYAMATTSKLVRVTLPDGTVEKTYAAREILPDNANGLNFLDEQSQKGKGFVNILRYNLKMMMNNPD